MSVPIPLRKHRRWRLAASAAVAVAGVVALPPGTAGAAGTTLATAAAGSGRYFGTAVTAGRLGDAQYTGILDREFAMITPADEMKWDAIEWSRTVFTFGPADRIVDHARAHNQRMRGHTLVSHSQLPSWVGGIRDATALREAMNNHINVEMGRYRGQIYAWDVVNEAFADNSGQQRRSVFHDVLGPGFVEEAFRTARAADPAAKLCYSDYGIEDWNSAKTQGVFRMVQDFRNRGVPIDCVGFQSHFGSGGPPANFQTTLAGFAALGVEVQLTELDIVNAPATGYAAAVQACLNVSGCAGISTGGIRDSDSWRSNDKPLLFDRNGTKKAAYDAVLTALNGGTVAGPRFQLHRV